MSTAAAVVLFFAIVLYAVFAGADFGAGFWDLTAGRGELARRARALLERSIGPVWEANHVWLIFGLVVLWTAFPSAFAAIMTTLFVPLGAAALGIVLRGCGFAFRKALAETAAQRVSGVVFASSSVVTPFCLGAVAGGIASGRVPPGLIGGNAWTSWVNPTSLLGGLLALATCAYLAAVFLVAEARARRVPELERWFRRRVFASAGVAGALSVAGVFVLHSDARRLFDHLLGPGLAFVLIAAACGLAVLVLAGRAGARLLRLLAVAAVGSVVVGWGVAQYPYLLGTHLRIAEGAAPPATLGSLLVISAAAATLCVPSLVLLYLLQQRGQLEGT